MGNAVPGILPSLVSQAALCLALVFDEAVAVLVAVLVDPAQGCLGRGKQLLPGRPVVGPLQIFRVENEEQRGGVHAPVIGRMRDLPGARQLAAADLVEDLSRFLLAEIVHPPPLVRGQEQQRIAGDVRIDEQRLEGGDRGVAAERRGVPRDAGGDHAASLPEHGERFQIRHRLGERPVESLLVRLDARAVLRPVAVVGAGARHTLLESARGGRLRDGMRAWIQPSRLRLLGHRRRWTEARLPRRVRRLAHRRSRAHRMQRGKRVQLEPRALVRPEVEVEARPPTGDLVGRTSGKEHFYPVEDSVPALVAGYDAALVDQGAEVRSPRATPGAPDLELVGEVSRELVLDPVVDVAHQVVGEREPLDEVLVDDLLAPKVQEVDRVLEEAPELRAGDRQVDLRSVLGPGLRREHDWRAAGDRQPQLAEEARVLEVGALIARSRRPDVAEPSGDGEEVAALEHQLVGAGGLGQGGQVFIPEQLRRADGHQRPGGTHLIPPRRCRTRLPPRRAARRAPRDRRSGSPPPSAWRTTAARPACGFSRG